MSSNNSDDTGNSDDTSRRPAVASYRRPRRLRAFILIVLFTALGAFIGGAFVHSGMYESLSWKELPSKLANLLGKKAPAGKAIYYCPMHPNYHSDKPGTCPICGMDLEKLEPEKDNTAAGGNAMQAAGESKPDKKVLYWVDPMNPTMRYDKPGKAPCGMDLEPVYADGGSESAESLPPGTVKISPQKQQLIGVKYGEVQEHELSKTIRTVGKVTMDETRVARINSKITGWVDHVYIDFTGMLVKKGQPVVSIYSPEVVSTQQELLIAKKSKETLASSPFKEIGATSNSLYESTRERLKLWDISEAQIKQIEKQGTPIKSLTLYSPIDGFVLNKNVLRGQQVTPETELYTIADLSKIWVMADIYEYELPLIRNGQAAVMTLPYSPGKEFIGRVNYVNPQVDPTTRTLKARIEFQNPNYLLKPDMFANIEIKIDYGKHLAIPQEALLNSGAEQIVFVAREGGYFEPRRVKIGQQVGDLVTVQDGLKAGERVVTSAHFLIDSESQLKTAVGAISSGGGGESGSGAHAGHQGSSSGAGPQAGRDSTMPPGMDMKQDNAGMSDGRGAQAGATLTVKGPENAYETEKPAGRGRTGAAGPKSSRGGATLKIQ